MLVLATTRISVPCNHVPSVFQVQQCPMLGVATNNDVPSTTAIASIRPAFGRHSVAHEMGGAGASSAGTAANLYVIDKIFT